MRQIRELQKALLNELCKFVGQYGFDAKLRGQSFYKRLPFGLLALHVTFIKHRIDFDVTVDVAVRFDKVEELLNEQRPNLSEAEKRKTFTLGAELGSIDGTGQKRWTVESLVDVSPVAESIMQAFETIGLPYLQKYSDMQAALEALSSDDGDASLHMPLHDERAKTALALAFLLGDRERFSQLAVVKTEFLSSRNEQGLQSFIQLRDSLARRLNGQRDAR